MNRLSFSKGQFLSYLSAVLISVFFVAAAVFGATTISTNISTDGTLTVAGASTLSGALTVAGASTLSGAATLSSTLAVTGDSNVNGMATTTAATGNFGTEGSIAIATSSPAQELGVVGDGFFGSAATTTLFLDTTSGGGCIQMRGATSSVVYRMYISEGGSGAAAGSLSLRVERGACK